MVDMHFDEVRVCVTMNRSTESIDSEPAPAVS